MRGLRDIVARLKLLETIDHHIKLIKVETDRAINRLLGDLIGLFRRSNIPDCERPKSGESKRLNEKVNNNKHVYRYYYSPILKNLFTLDILFINN